MKWGNALGGWRKQKRAKNGQFGSGGGKAKGPSARSVRKSQNKAFSQDSKAAKSGLKSAKKSSKAQLKSDIRARKAYDASAVKTGPRPITVLQAKKAHQKRIGTARREAVHSVLGSSKSQTARQKGNRKAYARKVNTIAATQAAVGIGLLVAAHLYEAKEAKAHQARRDKFWEEYARRAREGTNAGGSYGGGSYGGGSYGGGSSGRYKRPRAKQTTYADPQARRMDHLSRLMNDAGATPAERAAARAAYNRIKNRGKAAPKPKAQATQSARPSQRSTSVRIALAGVRVV